MVIALVSILLAALLLAVLLYLGSPRQKLLVRPLRWFVQLPLSFVCLLWLIGQSISAFGTCPGIYIALTFVMALLFAVPFLFSVISFSKTTRRLR